MNTNVRFGLEALLGLAILAGIVAAVAQLADPAPLFIATMVGIAVLYVAVYLAPRPMTRIMSMPFAFRFDQNRGKAGFEMQAVSYAAFHTRALADITHTGFAADAVAWIILLHHALGGWGVAGLVLLKATQIASYGDRKLAGLLGGAWIVVGGIAAGGVNALGPPRAVELAMITVLATGVWRVVGHATEPIPPGVSRSHRFVPLEDLGFTPTLGVSAFVGYFAESGSGLPFRLFDVWVFDTCSRLFGFEPDRLISRPEVVRQRADVFEGGWGAAPATRHLLTIDASPVRSPERRSSLPPYPTGWYAIAFSDELPPGYVQSATFCGDEVVVFRTVAGEPVVMDAHCPHLGAHLAVGGRVEGETIRCPFHGFRFDTGGTCVATGYGTDPPRDLTAGVRHSHEMDGVVLAWHDSAGGPPGFRIPELDEHGWSPLRHRTYRLRDHPQETTENGVDLGHFAFVHGYDSVEMLEPVSTNGAVLHAAYSARRPMPWLSTLAPPVRFEFRPEIHGLGYSLVHVSIPEMSLRARLLVLATPIDGMHIHLRLALRLSRIDDRHAVHPLARLLPRAMLESLISRLILDGFAGDAGADFPIWENKAYVERPRLAKGDGPIGVYRAWASQFYRTPATTVIDLSVVTDEIDPAPAP